MDWNLWSPSYSRVAPDSYHRQPGWPYDLYFCCGLDVIEEDALNEKSCVQVLRVLIAKADTEIEELEKDLVILQSELAWAESREWSEICSTSLREKINCLDISIQSLKNENEHDINVHLLMHRKPAERIHEIIKVLLRRHCLEKDEQAAHSTIENSSMNTPSQDSWCSSENMKFSNFCSKIVKEEIQHSSTPTPNCLKIVKEEVQHSSTPTPNIVILESSLKPQGSMGEVDEKVKPPSTVVEDFSLDALEYSTNNSDEKQSKSNTKDDSTLTDDYKILISSLKCGGKRKNYQKFIKPTTVVKNSNLYAARCEISLDRKKKSYMSISRSDVLVLTDSGGADASPKISNYPRKTVQEKIIRVPKVAVSNKTNSAIRSPMPDRKNMTVQEAAISDDEQSAVNSLPEFQDEKGKDTTKLHPGEEGASQQAEKAEQAKNPANDQKSILCPSLKLPKPKAKRKIQSNQLSIQEAGRLTTESGLNSSSVPKVKRRQKFGISKDNASLTESLDVKILKNIVLQSNCEGDERGLTPDRSENSVLLSQKRSEKSLKFPVFMEIEDSTIYNKLPKLHADTTDGGGEEDLFIKSCSIGDSHDENTKSLPCPTPKLPCLEKMKLVDLRAIAKKHNITKYHKLKKDALVQAIANQQS